jgi:hypothetical protein
MWKTYHTKDLTEKYLFKFLPKKFLFDFIETKNIWFSRADQFGDKMECVRISDLLQEKPDYKEIERRKLKYLISCWHVANTESLAFWDTYSYNSKDRRTVAIRFKRHKLTELMREWVFINDRFHIETTRVYGKVEYKNLVNTNNSRLNNSKVKYPALRKESAFEYENEFRFVIQLPRPYSGNGFGFHLRDICPNDYDIIINPLLNKNEFTETKLELKQKGIENIQESVLTKWLNPEEW